MSDSSQHNPVEDNAKADVQPISDKPSQAEGDDTAGTDGASTDSVEGTGTTGGAERDQG